MLAVGARGIQKLLVLKALVLLDAGEGLTVDAFEQIDLGNVVFNQSFIFLITNSTNTLLTVRDTRNDSHFTAVCPVADLSLAPGQGSPRSFTHSLRFNMGSIDLTLDELNKTVQ